MLIKLLKYDLKWNYKLIVIFYALALIFSLITRIFISIDNSLLFDILGKITGSCAIAMMCSALINTLMRSWSRFVRNIYKDESYLTHTLPVEKRTIFLSKVLSALICSLTTIIVMLLCLFICYYSKENIKLLSDILSLTASVYNTSVINLALIISMVLFLELLFILLIGYTGIIIGHKYNQNKIVKSIIWGFGLYMITSIVSLLLIFVLGVFNKDVMNIINTTNSININSIKVIMYATIVIYLIYNIIYYFIGKWQLSKGVNVD